MNSISSLVDRGVWRKRSNDSGCPVRRDGRVRVGPRARAGNYLDEDTRKTVWPLETFHLQGPGSLHLGRARYPYTHIVCHDNPEIWLNDPFLNLIPEGEAYDLSPIAEFKISGIFKLYAPCEIIWAEGQLSGDFTVEKWPDETPLFDPEYGSHGWLEHSW